MSLGIHQAVLDETTRFCTERQRYGKPLADLANIKLKLGRIQSRLLLGRLSAYHAVHLLDQGLPCDAELMNAKLVNVESALESARDAMDIHAACGLFTDRPVERFLRDAHHIFAPAGTSDIQLLRLGELALGRAQGDWSSRLADLLRLEPSEWPEEDEATDRAPAEPPVTVRPEDPTPTVPGQRTGPTRPHSWFARPR